MKNQLKKARSRFRDCRKIEYTWHTEFINFPKWLQKPSTWDWMIIA